MCNPATYNNSASVKQVLIKLRIIIYNENEVKKGGCRSQCDFYYILYRIRYCLMNMNDYIKM